MIVKTGCGTDGSFYSTNFYISPLGRGLVLRTAAACAGVKCGAAAEWRGRQQCLRGYDFVSSILPS